MWIEPDILLHRNGSAVALVDAKYKVAHESVRNPDVYQMIAYAQRFGLRSAHLVYVGDQETSQRLEIIGAPVEVHTHALDLSISSEKLLEAVHRMVDQILADLRRTGTSPLKSGPFMWPEPASVNRSS